MIKYLFTTRGGFGSRIISSFTKADGQKTRDTPAHMSILFFNFILLESRLKTNVHLTYWGVEKKKVRVIKSYEPILVPSLEVCMSKLKILLEKSYALKYDKKALIYLGWRRFLKRYFKRKIPKDNRFDDPNRYFCDELWELDDDGEEASMLSPNDVMMKMSKDARYRECKVE